MRKIKEVLRQLRFVGSIKKEPIPPYCLSGRHHSRLHTIVTDSTCNFSEPKRWM